MKKKGLAVSLSSMLAGLGLGMLVAPKKGKELREDIKNKAKDVKEKGVKNTLKDELKKLEKEVDKLTDEKLKPVAKEKSDELMNKLEKPIEKAIVKIEKLCKKGYSGNGKEKPNQDNYFIYNN